MRYSKKIIFITPSLGSTGSEILLYHFINHLSNNHDIVVICYKNGDLIKTLNPTVKVHVLDINTSKRFLQKIKQLFIVRYKFPKLLNKYKNDSWYINTIILPLPVKYAVKYNIDFTLHVHELKHMYALLTNEQLQLALNKPKCLIANSTITKQHLVDEGSHKNIKVINPFIDFKLIESYKKSINNNKTTICWAMAGSIDANKNPSLFISIAKEAQLKKLPYTFKWFYQSVSDEALFTNIIQSIKTNNLPVEFIKTLNYEEYLTHFSQADGLLLTSTFESFSMVTLESLTLNIAIVATDCGGINEFLSTKVASIVTINSTIDTYLEAMQNELEKRGKQIDDKICIAKAYDKTQLLFKWSELLNSTFIKI